MALVERLGYKTLDAFYSEYDNNMIAEWMAYDLSNSVEWSEKAEKEIALERQKNNTAEQEAEMVRGFFMGLGK